MLKTISGTLYCLVWVYLGLLSGAGDAWAQGEGTRAPPTTQQPAGTLDTYATREAAERIFGGAIPPLLGRGCSPSTGLVGQVCSFDHTQVPVPAGAWELLAFLVETGKQDPTTNVWNRHEAAAAFGMIHAGKVRRLITVRTDAGAPVLIWREGKVGFSPNKDCAEQPASKTEISLHYLASAIVVSNNITCVLVNKAEILRRNPYNDEFLKLYMTRLKADSVALKGVEAYTSTSLSGHYMEYKVFFPDSDDLADLAGGSPVIDQDRRRDVIDRWTAAFANSVALGTSSKLR